MFVRLRAASIVRGIHRCPLRLRAMTSGSPRARQFGARRIGIQGRDRGSFPLRNSCKHAAYSNSGSHPSMRNTQSQVLPAAAPNRPLRASFRQTTRSASSRKVMERSRSCSNLLPTPPPRSVVYTARRAATQTSRSSRACMPSSTRCASARTYNRSRSQTPSACAPSPKRSPPTSSTTSSPPRRPSPPRTSRPLPPNPPRPA